MECDTGNKVALRSHQHKVKSENETRSPENWKSEKKGSTEPKKVRGSYLSW